MEQRQGPDDQELVARARRGDVDAFEILYRRHRDWVVTLAYRFCGHREDALDVMLETFAYVLRKLPDLELRSQMRTFLYPAVKHLALSRARAGPGGAKCRSTKRPRPRRARPPSGTPRRTARRWKL